MDQYSGHKFEFEISVLGEDITDVSSMSVIRCPFVHTASYTMLNLSLRTLLYLVMQSEIEKGDYPEIEITCHILDMSKPKSDGGGIKVGERVEKLFKKTFLILKCTTHEYPTKDANKINATMVLVHPVLLYLNTVNSYNKILLGKTALDMIKDYEKHLKDTYGDIFEFKKVGENHEKNDHDYEQVLIRLENDLVIPTWLIQTYKPFHTPAFYFFDDFRIDDESKKDITAYLINLGKKDEFTKKTTLDANDIFMANKFVKNIQIGDIFNETTSETPSIIGKDYNMFFQYKKAEGQTQVPKGKQSDKKFQMDDRDFSAVEASKPTKSSAKPTEIKMTYAPDKIDNAMKRYKNANKLLKTDISHTSVWTLKDSHMDYIQFGKAYVLNPHESTEYRHTPISIVNHFVRESGMYPYLIHNCVYQTLAFKAEKEWM